MTVCVLTYKRLHHNHVSIRLTLMCQSLLLIYLERVQYRIHLQLKLFHPPTVSWSNLLPEVAIMFLFLDATAVFRECNSRSDAVTIVSVVLTLLLLIVILLLVLSGVANVVLLRIKQRLQNDLSEHLHNETKIYEEISLQISPQVDCLTEENKAYGVAPNTRARH